MLPQKQSFSTDLTMYELSPDALKYENYNK